MNYWNSIDKSFVTWANLAEIEAGNQSPKSSYSVLPSPLSLWKLGKADLDRQLPLFIESTWERRHVKYTENEYWILFILILKCSWRGHNSIEISIILCKNCQCFLGVINVLVIHRTEKSYRLCDWKVWGHWLEISQVLSEWGFSK